MTLESKIKSLFLISFVCLSALSETNHSLVPDIPAAAPRRATASDPCDVNDLLDREMIFSESEKMTSRLLIHTLALTNRYETVRELPAMRQLQLTDGQSAAAVRSFMRFHEQVSNSSLDPNATRMVIGVPSAIFGAASIFGIVAPPPPGIGNPRSGVAGISSLFGSQILIHSGETLHSLLPSLSRDLRFNDHVAVHRTLERELAPAARALGARLSWTDAERDHFSRALESAVLDGLVKNVGRGKNGTKVTAEVTAAIGSIDVVKIMENEKLVSPEIATALRQLDALHKSAVSVARSENITLEQFRARLGGTSSSVQSRIADLVRLHRLLTDCEKDLPPGSDARRALLDLINESANSIETIRAYCRLAAQ